MRIFLDRNISSRTTKLLRCFDTTCQIDHHDDHFDQNTPDTEWIQHVSLWRPIPAVLCGDGKILTRKHELAVLKGSGLTFIHLAKHWTTVSWEGFAWRIIKVWPEIVKAVIAEQKPRVLTVKYKNLKVEPGPYIPDLKG